MAYFVLPFKALSVSQTHFELQSPSGSLRLLHYCQPHGLETLPVHCSLLFLYWSAASAIRSKFSGLCTATISTKSRCWISIMRLLYLKDRKRLTHFFFYYISFYFISRDYFLNGQLFNSNKQIDRGGFSVKKNKLIYGISSFPSQIRTYQLALLIWQKLLQMSRSINI